MLNYVLKRLLGLIPTLLIVAVLVFLFVHLLPGDPARLIAGPEADAQVIALVRQQLGLDQPLHVQFWRYITHVLQGDFGTSMVSRRPVSEEIASRFFADAVADDNQYDMGGAVWHGDRHRRRRVA
ncbi:ABC transporter permease [Salmonella enterica subsp. enterica]|uniref:ABC transporter permease n=1 Tax=Salmonella enterica I TaxID=59201 RepID=A0A447U6E7_SALET|nr:ABC transporter permease [Salmonella enterica subsp. enterica]